ncbi:MAG TPA: hopanoid-associated sugar epimerase [Acidimicrobiales bacterium]|nr:hopanoid-associated sugar epimerase [Acidimicrobiales bacterium]
MTLPESYRMEAGERVVVTGAAGFIGSAVTRELLERNTHVVALVQPGGDNRNLEGLEVERVSVDLRDADGVAKAVDGARTVFHLAALYRFWAADPQSFYEVNVVGTRNLIRAAEDAGVGRVVYTSTVGTLGLRGASSGAPVDETSYAQVDHLFGLYKQSKYVAEHEVLRAAAQGLPVVLVQPTTPVGPGDRAPTPTGRTVLQFLNGPFPAFVDTTLNIVDVDDVAHGHLLAAERGSIGRSYILGGENLSLQQILASLAEATGLSAPSRRVPNSLAVLAATVSDVIEGRLLHREPSIPLEAAKMSTTQMSFDDSRARRELGYHSRPAGEALARAAHWFADAGYVRADRLSQFRWRT